MDRGNNGGLDGLAANARRLLIENARGLTDALSPNVPLDVRAKRPWDLWAKKEIAEQIGREEKARAGRAHNDFGDAMRHARWSKRTAEATGPVFADAAGIAYEIGNLANSLAEHGPTPPYGGRVGTPTPSQTIDEMRMDLHNNAEGRRAAAERRRIDPGRLQAQVRTPPWTALYRPPPAGRTGIPPR